MLSYKFLFYLFLGVALSSLTSFAQRVIPTKDSNEIMIAFGSCNAYYGDEPADIFYRIVELHPDVWVWLGDVAYVDEKVFPPIFAYAGEEKVKQTFQAIKNRREYSALRNTTPIIGVWDDHDYGLNNGNKHFEHKDVVQQLWLDFMDEPLNSSRRKRPGVYESYYIGDASKIKVILLDVRYFRDAPGEQDDVLGDVQWAWLENELLNNTAQFTIIGSGVQILPDDRIIPESWYAKSRERLVDFIKKNKLSGIILISGDVHYAEIMQYPCKERVGYDLFEFTSSGLTHHVSTHVPFAEGFVKYLYPDTFSLKEQRYTERNFGVLKFSFGKNPYILFEARNYSGDVVLEQNISSRQITFNDEITRSTRTCILEKNPTIRFLEKNKQNLLAGEPFMYLMIGVLILVLTLIFFLFWGTYKVVRLLCFRRSKKKTE